MAQHQLLTTTTLRDVQPIAVGGRPVYELYNQIVAKVREGLGARHADLFAEPSYNTDNGTLDWFTGASGTAVPLSELPTAQEQADRARPILQAVREISEYAERLEAAGGSEARLQAQMIRAALMVPRPGDIFLAGDQAVLTNWGLRQTGEEAGPTELVELLRRVMRAAAPIPSIQAPPLQAVTHQVTPTVIHDSSFTTRFVTAQESLPAKRRHRWAAWPLWGIFALSLAVVGWLLLRNCAIGTPYSLGIFDRIFVTYCTGARASAPPPVRPDNRETSTLLAQLSELERRYFQAVQRCPRECEPPSQPPPPVENVPPPPRTDPNLCETLRAQGRSIGAANLVLEWGTTDDLDLHIFCPRGGKIYYRELNACGANLQQDVLADDNAAAGVTKPIEDARFSTSSPPGEYVVYVDRFKRRSGPESGTPFKLTLLSNGRPVQVKTGTAVKADVPNPPAEVILRFTLPLQDPSSAPLPPECADVPVAPGTRQ